MLFGGGTVRLPAGRVETPQAAAGAHPALDAEEEALDMIDLAVNGENSVLQLLGADVMLSSSFYERPSSGPAAEGARALMLAVLENAVSEFFKSLPCETRRQRRLLQEVEEWFAARDPSWLFSFEHICAALAIDAGYVRLGLRRWKARRQARGKKGAPGPRALRRAAGGRVAVSPLRSRRAA